MLFVDAKSDFDDNVSMPQIFVVHVSFTLQHNLVN